MRERCQGYVIYYSVLAGLFGWLYLAADLDHITNATEQSLVDWYNIRMVHIRFVRDLQFFYM
jgi:hypothetical protein